MSSGDKNNYGEVTYALQGKLQSFLSVPIEPLNQIHTTLQFANN